MKRIHRSVRISDLFHPRSGLTTPAVAVALLLVMTGIALIIDRIWLETAQLELRTAAEAAALAAANDLVGDDLLVSNPDDDLRLSNARQSAGTIASRNYVAGSPVVLNIEPDGDIVFGQLVQEPQGVKFEESSDNPTTVVVTARRTRSNNNPVALFIAGASGISFGDVATHAEATVNNDVMGLRPFEGSAIPALPIAIWQFDPEEKRSDTWDIAIEARQGADVFMFDAETHTVVPGADGIPELTLRSFRTGGETSDANVQLLDIGTGLGDVEVNRQFESGISAEDLESFDGEIRIGQGATLDFTATPDLSAVQSSDFEDMIGECRICFLYSAAKPLRKQPMTTATCTEIVAVRVMAVNVRSDGSSDVTIQPTVMLSRTVMLSSEISVGLENGLSNGAVNSFANGNTSNTGSNAAPNRYLYKLRLTH